MREFSRNLKPIVTVPPAARSAAAVGLAVDRLGFDGLAFLVSFGAWTDGTHTIIPEESDDGTTWTAVAAGNLSAGIPVVAAASGAGLQAIVGYMGDARYVRARTAVIGATNGAVLGVTVILGRARQRPAT